MTAPRERDKLGEMSTSEPPPRPKEDVVFVHGPAESGEGLRVIRKRDDVLEIGEIRAVKEGRPLQGDLVKLKPRPDHDRLFDVDVLVSREEIEGKGKTGAPALRAHAGPAQVATEEYRANWDAIFGQRGEPELPN
jgi:hypothetical protein